MIGVYTLRDEYRKRYPQGHFFDDDTLKFFGERLSDMRVLKDIYTVKDIRGEVHRAYCLSSLQRNYPGGPRRSHHYFDVETFDDIITA